MVLIGGVKYACERCIRGHRVTTCNHTDQPLMMIKPKGRPSSQCKHCKDMRKAKNTHSTGACTCGKKTSKVASVTKLCGCETGKPCQCHSKRTKKLPSPPLDSSATASSASSAAAATTPQDQTDNNNNHSGKEGGVRQIGMDPLRNAKPMSTSTRTRVGEVSVPLEEYIPSRGDGLGNVNGKLPAFFQDVPMPFETGHGLLDLFADTQSESSLRRSASSTSTSSEHFGSTATTPMSIKMPQQNQQQQQQQQQSQSQTPHRYSPMIHRPSSTLFGSFDSSLKKDSSTTPITATTTDSHSIRDDSSVHSVEVLSLTPTFMDIPDFSKSYFTKRKTSSSTNLSHSYHIHHHSGFNNPQTTEITDYHPHDTSSTSNNGSSATAAQITSIADAIPNIPTLPSDDGDGLEQHDKPLDQFDMFATFSNDTMFGLGEGVVNR